MATCFCQGPRMGFLCPGGHGDAEAKDSLQHPLLSLGAAVLCGPPPAVPQGTVEGTDFRWGASISYRCVPGFQLSHSAILSCEGHGVWRGDPPQCLREYPGQDFRTAAVLHRGGG